MKQYIFSHKDIQGGVPAVLEGIKKEFIELIKHLDCAVEDVDDLLGQLRQELTRLQIQLRRNPSDESLKSKIEEIKNKVKSLTIVLAVKQKIEELTNYSKNEQSKSENINVSIDIYECMDIGEDEEEDSSLSTIGR